MLMMKTKDVIDHFGTIALLAKAIGVKAPSIYSWGVKVPALRQYQIEKKTRGRLKAETPARRG